ncbi:MAG: thiopurine S-methyltransferase [Pseudomonadota bacterium]
MDDEFWLNKWTTNEIGFHEPEPHPCLVAHWDKLALPRNSIVFVPLCGKSNDMRWLVDQGYRVVAVELSDLACRAYFEENAIDFEVVEHGPFNIYESKECKIYQGDVFRLQSNHLAGVAAIYDRAALIALDPASRQRYSELLDQLTPNAKSLTITVHYDETILTPPPFIVPDDEVRQRHIARSLEFLGETETQVKGEPATEHSFLIR